jgi:hypothetical protein
MPASPSASLTPPPHPLPLTVLVDDVRSFRDERPARVARSSQDALKILTELRDTRIDHLWLDHDLVGEDTIRPVVDHLVQQARAGSRLDVGQIHIQSANVGGGHWMDAELRQAGYRVVFSYALAIWTREGR